VTSVLLMLAILASPPYHPDLDERVMELAKQLRCLVCQNETLADSHAELAADLRQQIREQMKDGRTDMEITAFLTNRYGDFVLYRPPVNPRTYALWFGPFVLLAGGSIALLRFLKRWPGLMKCRPLSKDERRRATALLQFGRSPNTEVYREQFAEMESDYRTGFVDLEQFERDREELERRLLEDCRPTFRCRRGR